MKSENKIWRNFVLNISLIVLLFFLGVFIGLYMSNKNLIESELLSRARSHFNDIVLARRWNAQYNGVFVEKTSGMISNPYLVNPDIRTVDNKVFTKKNPALMTREISELASVMDYCKYHITSLLPLNPHNKADEFETKALMRFEKGIPEVRTKDVVNGDVIYRYMAPLRVEKSCLSCHGKQGYRVGDVRGGISVSFNINNTESSLTRSKYITLGLFLLTTLLLLYIIFIFIRKFYNTLRRAAETIERMAITDELTQLYNRRYMYEYIGKEINRSGRYNRYVGCLMIDIDFFKTVNDTYGHIAGDSVLVGIARVLKDNCRKTDVIGRYGGEEFVVLAPEAGTDEIRVFAEKIRAAIEKTPVPIDVTTSVAVTVSIGAVAVLNAAAEKIHNTDALVGLADKALYRAKNSGRNRVVLADKK